MEQPGKYYNGPSFKVGDAVEVLPITRVGFGSSVFDPNQYVGKRGRLTHVWSKLDDQTVGVDDIPLVWPMENIRLIKKKKTHEPMFKVGQRVQLAPFESCSGLQEGFYGQTGIINEFFSSGSRAVVSVDTCILHWPVEGLRILPDTITRALMEGQIEAVQPVREKTSSKYSNQVQEVCPSGDPAMLAFLAWAKDTSRGHPPLNADGTPKLKPEVPPVDYRTKADKSGEWNRNEAREKLKEAEEALTQAKVDFEQRTS